MLPQVQRDGADLLSPYFTADGLVARCLQYAQTLDHIMDFTRLRALSSLFSMLNQMVRNIMNYNQFHPDFPLQVCSPLSLSPSLSLFFTPCVCLSPPVSLSPSVGLCPLLSLISLSPCICV